MKKVLGVILSAGLVCGGATQVRAAPLWSGLSSGMTADQAAAQAMKITGIRAAKAKTNRDGPSKVNLSYDKTGVMLLGMRLEVRPLFQGNSLAGVLLNSSKICVSQMNPRTEAIALGLRQKYPRDLGVGVVTLPGTKGAPQRANNAHRFTDGATRASFYLISNDIAPPEPLEEYERTNSVSQMNYSFKMITYKQLIASCPEGEQQSIHIIYEDLSEASARDLQYQNQNINIQNQKIDSLKKELEKL